MSSESLASIREAASSVYAVCTGRHTQLPQDLTFIGLIGILCQLSFREAPMPTRNVVLTDHQASLVEHLVASGRYQNASEVLREGLRLVEQREAEDAYRLEALRSAVQVGIDDIAAGNFKAFERKGSLRAHIKSITGKAIASK